MKSVWTLAAAFLLLVAAAQAEQPEAVTIETLPSIQIERVNKVDIGVVTKGTFTTYHEIVTAGSDVFTSDNNSQFTHSRTIESTAKKSAEKNKEKAKKKPGFGAILGQIVGGVASDNPLPIVDAFGKFADYALEPETTRDFSRSYSFADKTTDIVNRTRDEKRMRAVAWLDKHKTDLSAKNEDGFVKFGVLLRNASTEPFTIKDPAFSLEFRVGPNKWETIGQPTGKVAGQSEISLGAGDTAQLLVALEGQDFTSLVDKEARALEMRVSLETYEVKRADGTFVKEAEYGKGLKGVKIRLVTPGHLTEGVIPTKSGLTIRGLIEGLGLGPVEYRPEPQGLVDSVERIGFYRNRGTSTPLSEQLTDPDALQSWRQWLAVLYRHDQPADLALDSPLRDGDSLLLGYFDAKDVLGQSYRPVVFSKSGVAVTGQAGFKIPVELKPGDEIRIENAHVAALYGDRVTWEILDKGTANPAGWPKPFPSWPEFWRARFDKGGAAPVGPLQYTYLVRARDVEQIEQRPSDLLLGSMEPGFADKIVGDIIAVYLFQAKLKCSIPDCFVMVGEERSTTLRSEVVGGPACLFGWLSTADMVQDTSIPSPSLKLRIEKTVPANAPWRFVTNPVSFPDHVLISGVEKQKGATLTTLTKAIGNLPVTMIASSNDHPPVVNVLDTIRFALPTSGPPIPGLPGPPPWDYISVADGPALSVGFGVDEGKYPLFMPGPNGRSMPGNKLGFSMTFDVEVVRMGEE